MGLIDVPHDTKTNDEFGQYGAAKIAVLLPREL